MRDLVKYERKDDTISRHELLLNARALVAAGLLKVRPGFGL